MHSTLALAAPCLKTEDKKLFTPSIQLHKNLLQNPAYQVAIPALLELHAGRTFSHNADEKPLKLEISPPKMRPETFSEVPPEFKMDSIPHTTLLNYHPITAFSVGGELRLCLPQVMNSVLKNYSLQQIEHKINELNIYISRCSNEQAKCLKLIKVLPERVPYCGLITKSNAERLVHELLEKESESIGQSDATKKVTLSSEVSGKLFGFRVYHECFGKCKGTLYPTLFVEPEAKCIECLECKYLFAPNKFVCHAHRGHESIGICHWGFDSANWRSYIQISKDQENSKELDGHLEQMKGKTFDSVQSDSLNSSAMGVVKRKLEPESTEKVLIPPIISTQGNVIGNPTQGATPKKKFPRVDCDSGFGSSPDSNSNRSPTTSPPVLTSANSNATAATTLSSLSTASGLRIASSGLHNSATTLPAQVLATSQGSQLASVIKNSTDLYSQILTSSAANQNVVSSALQLGANGSVALIAAGLQKQQQQQNGLLQLPRSHSTPYTLIKSSGDKLGGGSAAVSAAQLYSSPAAQLTTFPSSSVSSLASPGHTTTPHTSSPSCSVSSPHPNAVPTSNATPNSQQQQQQQELQRQLIAIETNAGNISPAAVSSNAAILLQQQLKQQQPSIIQSSPQNVPGSNPHAQQPSPAHIALAAHHSGVPQGSLQQTAAPSVVVPPFPSPRDSALAPPSIVPGIRSIVQAAAPPVTMATDLVSPELRMISQAMEVTIAKMNAHCSPSVKLHLDQLVELLKEQQKQYLKDFALTHQENERLTMELKTKEKEISDAKIALSKVRQDLQQTDIELHNEKTLRLRNQVDLAQVLRHQQAIGTYNSVMLQHQQQKLQQNAILKNDAILAARPCIITPENVAEISTNSCDVTRDSEITKCEPDWSSLSPASDNSDRETPTGSPTTLNLAADIENHPVTSPSHEMELRTPTNGSPSYPDEEEPETELTNSRCETDDAIIGSEVDMQDDDNVTSSDLRDEDSDCTTRATPSPTNSNENSSHLVIVDS